MFERNESSLFLILFMMGVGLIEGSFDINFLLGVADREKVGGRFGRRAVF